MSSDPLSHQNTFECFDREKKHQAVSSYKTLEHADTS